MCRIRGQRRSVSVFSFYNPASVTEGGDQRLILNGQGSLARLSDETGGRAFFQGSIAPISFEPFFQKLTLLLNRQFLLSYLSTAHEPRLSQGRSIEHQSRCQDRAPEGILLSVSLFEPYVAGRTHLDVFLYQQAYPEKRKEENQQNCKDDPAGS